MGQLATAIAGIIIVGIIVYQLFLNITEAIGAPLFWLLCVGIVALPFALYFYFIYVQPQSVFRKRLQAAPETGPMKVNIRTEQLTKGLSKTPVYRLHIDVKLSQKDMRALRDSGIELHSLFNYPDPKFPDQEVPFRNAYLSEPTYVDFPDIQALDKAKDELMSSLHFLRQRLDQTSDMVREQKYTNTSEKFEI